VLKTSTRQTIFLPVVGLVDAEALKPGDLVGVNKVGWGRGLGVQGGARESAGAVAAAGGTSGSRRRPGGLALRPHCRGLHIPTLANEPSQPHQDSYLVLDTLPAEYDSRVKAMEVDEKPTEDYSDIGGLDKQVGGGSRWDPGGTGVAGEREEGVGVRGRRRSTAASGGWASGWEGRTGPPPSSRPRCIRAGCPRPPTRPRFSARLASPLPSLLRPYSVPTPPLLRPYSAPTPPLLRPYSVPTCRSRS
jgi:hypothetical protein